MGPGSVSGSLLKRCSPVLAFWRGGGLSSVWAGVVWKRGIIRHVVGNISLWRGDGLLRQPLVVSSKSKGDSIINHKFLWLHCVKITKLDRRCTPRCSLHHLFFFSLFFQPSPPMFSENIPESYWQSDPFSKCIMRCKIAKNKYWLKAVLWKPHV